jgi:hypothetical protein
MRMVFTRFENRENVEGGVYRIKACSIESFYERPNKYLYLEYFPFNGARAGNQTLISSFFFNLTRQQMPIRGEDREMK